MRVVSILFYCLSAIAAILSALFYLYVNAMACAFVVNSNKCRAKWPWELRGEDFTILVLIPCLIVGVLFVMGWLFGRAAKQS